jgi:TATA-binding protein-associated factor Taf7
MEMRVNNILERLRALSCKEGMSQDELDTVMQAIRTIESLRKELRDQDREFQREAREIAAEARWQERNERDGDPYGTY